MLKVWLSVALVALGSSARAGDFRVMPGVRLGSIRLGESAADVHRALGKPSLSRTLRGRVREESWLNRLKVSYEQAQGKGKGYWKYRFVNAYFLRGRVVQVETNSPRFHTSEGLSVANSARRWQRTFHPAKQWSNENAPFINPDPGGVPGVKRFMNISDCLKRGIAWTLGGWGDLSPDLDPNDPLDTLVVHRVGTPMIKEPDLYVRFVFTSRDLPKNRPVQ